jgi:hypothetical protein|tara:strand:- start:224 stop:538 length:315 start_codon:yes stop_codon:yes gene_type:complete
MKKKSFPDMTGDGKVTKKDILKARGVPGFNKGGEMNKKKKGMVVEVNVRPATKTEMKNAKKMNKGGMVEDLGSPKEVSFKSAGGRSTMRGMGAATRGGKFQGVF